MLWWMQPGWADARCGSCGSNIKETGGDPDWGECFNCKLDRHEQEMEPSVPQCDICGRYDAVADVNGYGVCSAECDEEAQERGGDDQETACLPR